MPELIRDIINFMKNLDRIDILLYFAVLALIILIVSLVYIVKANEEEEAAEAYKNEIENNQDLDLNAVVKSISNNDPPNIEMTSYEKDQEEKAIISYDELLARNKNENLNYNEEEITNDEVSIKKIDLDHVIDTNNDEIQLKPHHLLKYTDEEDFLTALKELNQELNK